MSSQSQTAPQRHLRVFISHSSDDVSIARNLYNRFQDWNIDSWLDKEKLRGGQDWDLEIEKAMRSCDAVLICFTRDSVMKESYFQKEVKIALDLQSQKPDGVIFLIPIKLEACKLSPRLERLHCINYFEPDGFDKLIDALKLRRESLKANIKPIRYKPSKRSSITPSQNSATLLSQSSQSMLPNLSKEPPLNDEKSPPPATATKPKTHIPLRRLIVTGGILIAIIVMIGVGIFAINAVINSNHRSSTPTTPFPVTTQTPPATIPPHQTIYVGSGDGYLYALRDGKSLWRFATKSRTNIGSTPVVVDEVLYFGADDHYFYALRANDGLRIWEFHMGERISSKPVVVNGKVYFNSWDHNIYALRTHDGSVVWHYTTGGRIYGGPTIVNGVVYIGSEDSFVYALDAETGVLKWQQQTGGGNGTTTVVDEVLYVGSNNGNVYALQASDGTILWSYPTNGAILCAPTVANGMVYIGSYDHSIYALRAQDGTELWTFKTGDVVSDCPLIENGNVYVGSDDHYLYALDAKTGNLRWKYRGEVLGPSPWVIKNGIIYCNGYGLYIIRASDGMLLAHTFVGNIISVVTVI